MSEETKSQEKECKCFCHSKGFRKFLTIALGTFVGVYLALSLFAAVHKPPMPPQGFMPCPAMYNGCPVQMMQHHYDRGNKAKCHEEKFHKDKTPAPFDSKKIDR